MGEREKQVSRAFVKIYEKLKNALPLHEVYFDLEAFNKAIQIDPNHCWYKHTKTEILRPVIQEINRNTDILINKIRVSRKPSQGNNFWPVIGFTLFFDLNPAKKKKITKVEED